MLPAERNCVQSKKCRKFLLTNNQEGLWGLLLEKSVDVQFVKLVDQGDEKWVKGFFVDVLLFSCHVTNISNTTGSVLIGNLSLIETMKRGNLDCNFREFTFEDMGVLRIRLLDDGIQFLEGCRLLTICISLTTFSYLLGILLPFLTNWNFNVLFAEFFDESEIILGASIIINQGNVLDDLKSRYRSIQSHVIFKAFKGENLKI